MAAKSIIRSAAHFDDDYRISWQTIQPFDHRVRTAKHLATDSRQGPCSVAHNSVKSARCIAGVSDIQRKNRP